MAAIQNTTARQIDLRGRAENGAVITVTLNPGLNFVDDKKAECCMRNPLCVQLLDHGIIITNAKMTAEEQSIQKETQRQIAAQEAAKVHQVDKTPAAASLVPEDAGNLPDTPTPTAVGSMPGDADFVDGKGAVDPLDL